MCKNVGENTVAEERGLAEHLTQANLQRTYEDKEYTTLRHEAFSYIFFKTVAQPRLLKITEGTRICQHGKHKATSVQGVPTSVYLMEILSKVASNHVFAFNRDRKIAQDA